ncbi:MAG: ATP-binding cassette domain-containing protein [Phaeodactylibacter sp.]|nr:ATP-binding cassette domain-containing protein [Phaeodactylibacter sp.]MCB9274742.1 ATP-binding cassette domain-containing protein [Lewinellaceae bacterium]
MATRRQNNSSEAEPRPRLTREKLRHAARIFRYIRPYRWAFIGGMFLLFLSSMVFMIFPFLTGVMVDTAQGTSKYPVSLGQIGWILLLVLAAQGFVSYTRIYLFAIVSEKGIAGLRQALYEKLVSLPIVFFEQSRVGDLVSRLTSDVEKLYNAFSITLAEFFRQVIILVVGVALLAFRAPNLSLIMLATFPVIVIGAMFFGRFIRKLSKERQEELAASNTVVNETIQAIQAVKAFTNEFFEAVRYGKSIDKMVRIALNYARWRALFSVFIVSFLFGALFFIIWEGAYMVQNGTMSVGRLIEFVVYTGILGGAIAGLGNFYTELLGAIGATERIREILDEPGEVKVEKELQARRLPLKGNIRYEQVHFSYPTRKDMEVLKGLSFEVEAGKKIALVGSSGAGKSTIVQLLLKFYEIDGGDILVDGRSIYDMDTTAYRRNMAIVPQEVILFGGTIRENILYGKPEASEEEVIEAARQANAWDFIRSFPEGLATVVGERGVKLSGGQRQRIAIARAILKDPAILLLDEATSSLDAESEKAVQDALNKLLEGRTSIIIAHRLATIRNVDQIYVIDKGRIIEQGTHEELSLIEDGAYNSLARLQFEPI